MGIYIYIYKWWLRCGYIYTRWLIQEVAIYIYIYKRWLYIDKRWLYIYIYKRWLYIDKRWLYIYIYIYTKGG